MSSLLNMCHGRDVLFGLAVLHAASVDPGRALDNGLAIRPPMGWRSVPNRVVIGERK